MEKYIDVVRKEGKRTSKKKSKKNKLKKLFLKLLLFVIIVIGIIYFLTTVEMFNLKDIVIEGDTHYSKEDFENVLDIKYGENILKQMYHISKSNKTKLAYIEKIKISMVSSSTLRLTVKERQSSYIAFNKENSKYYKLNKEGYILEECDISKKSEDEVIISGISFDEEVKIGEKIDDIYLKKIDGYLNIKREYESTDLKNYGKITKVKFSNSLTTITINDKLNIVLQDDKNLKYNLSLLQGIIQKLPDNSVGIVDMTKPNPVYSAY